jgi:hypothetical protein
MIDIDSLDQVFVDDVLYMFDMGESINFIASVMGCDAEIVDAIICSCISSDTTELL